MPTLLGEQKFLELKTYLEQNWYDGEMFMIWGRRNEHGVPFARTTMHVEGHWSVIKRHYLMLHNRPRLDLVVYILAKRLMPKFEDDLRLLREGTKVPGWYKYFKKVWSTCVESHVNNNYETDIVNWHCTCKAYLLNRFFLCKHLVQKYAAINRAPEYREITRNRSAPFYEFRWEDGRPYALVE